MSFDLKTIRDDVITFLDSHNTTTTGISANLETGVQKIVGGTPLYGVYNTIFPIIWVTIGEHAEEINSMGNGSCREARFTIELYPATQVGYGHDDGQMKKAEDEIITLAQQIQDKIREDADMGISGLQVQGISASYNQDVPGETTYVKAAQITLNCYKLIN